MTIDFSKARFKHLNWQFRVRNFLDGKETLTAEQALSHKDCDLGKWYYSEGQAKYNHLEVMKKFEVEHEELHRLVKEIQSLKIANNKVEAESKFKILKKSSDTIVALLTEAENIINKDQLV